MSLRSQMGIFFFFSTQTIRSISLSYKMWTLVKVIFTFFLFTFTYLLVENALFLGQIFNLKILLDLHVLRSSKSENQFLVVGCVCVSVIIITKTNYSRIFWTNDLIYIHIQGVPLILVQTSRRGRGHEDKHY